MVTPVRVRMGSISSFFFLGGGGASPLSTHSPSSPSDLWDGLLYPFWSRGGEDDRLLRWVGESGGTRCLLRLVGELDIITTALLSLLPVSPSLSLLLLLSLPLESDPARARRRSTSAACIIICVGIKWNALAWKSASLADYVYQTHHPL